MEIVVQQSDITMLPADAVVNPANSQGTMGGGFAGALRQAGGEEIEKEAMGQAPIPVGEAVATTAGRLPYRYVIHAPTLERPEQPATLDNVRQATLAALMCADGLGVLRLAIPGMGTGVGRLDPASAAEAIVETLRHYETASVRKVILFDLNPEMVQSFRDAVMAERI